MQPIVIPVDDLIFVVHYWYEDPIIELQGVNFSTILATIPAGGLIFEINRESYGGLTIQCQGESLSFSIDSIIRGDWDESSTSGGGVHINRHLSAYKEALAKFRKLLAFV